MGLQVAKHRRVLLDIENSFKPEAKELEPLKPMIQTLEAYCKNSDTEELSVEQVIDKLGGHTSKYYQICQLMTRMYLQRDPNKKRRCMILSGVGNSGKSTIARYVSEIFDSHILSQAEGVFQEKMDKHDAHK